MSKKLALASAFVLCLTILSSAAWADNIPIANPSFESAVPFSIPCGVGCAYNYGPIPGWTTIKGAGTWQPGSYFSSIPDGSLVAFATPSNTLAQTLTGTSVMANSVYTLNVYVGDRTDAINGIYTLSLDTIVGGVTNTLCSFTGDASTIALGTFQLEGCSYTSGSNIPSGNLYLLFDAVTGQLDVDNVSLTVQPTSVPEPSSVLLLGVGMLLLLATFAARRKQKLQFTA